MGKCSVCSKLIATKDLQRVHTSRTCQFRRESWKPPDLFIDNPYEIPGVQYESIHLAKTGRWSSTVQKSIRASKHHVLGPSCDAVSEKQPWRKIYCGMMQEVDEGIGNITDALQEHNLLQNTVIIFLSDNGGRHKDMEGNAAGSNWPLRGQKGTMFEGGTRVPAVIWGEQIRPGSVERFLSTSTSKRDKEICNELFHLRDWHLTIPALANNSEIKMQLDFPDKKLVGSYNQLEMLQSLCKKPGLRETMVYDADSSFGAIRNKHYKLMTFGRHTSRAGWFNPRSQKIEDVVFPFPGQAYLLFKISEDETERSAIDLTKMNLEDSGNYTTLLEELQSWMGSSHIKMEIYQGGMTRLELSQMPFELGRLPRFVDCGNQPHTSTERFEVQNSLASQVCHYGIGEESVCCERFQALVEKRFPGENPQIDFEGIFNLSRIHAADEL